MFLKFGKIIEIQKKAFKKIIIKKLKKVLDFFVKSDIITMLLVSNKKN